MAKAVVLAPNTKCIVRNLLMQVDGTVLAGYRIGPVRWEFTGQEAKASAITASADAYANLTGRSYHERVCVQPHDVRGWAANLDHRTASPTEDIHVCDLSLPKGDLLNGLCGCETWGAHLIRQQKVVTGTGQDDKVILRYFSLDVKISPRVDLRKQILRYLAGEKVPHAITLLIEDEKRVNDIVVQGWAGSRRMREKDQAWVRVRSMAPGVQPSGIQHSGRDGWDDISLPVLSQDTRWHETPFGRTVGVQSYVNGKGVATAVRVLSAARMSNLHYPENGLPPWQVYSEQVRDSRGRSFSVEWSVSGQLLAGEDVASDAEFELKVALNTRRDYKQHGEIPPSATEQAIETAIDTRNQVTTGRAMEAARFQGQVNVIITGQAHDGLSAEEVCEERCAAFIRRYGGSALQMDFAGHDAQSVALRSTIPGEPYDRLAYNRRIRLPYLAAGMPNMSVVIGDERGPYLGRTRGGSSRPVHHDPHYATEGQRTGRQQNMHLMVGSLGSGKSVAKGAIAYNAVRRGIRTVISDPSGPLAVLCRMPEIAAVSQEVNLLNGRRGILSPPSLVRNPLLEEFANPGEYAEALAQARAERNGLVVDTAMRCLPDDLSTPASRAVLREAARKHAERSNWETSSTMWDLMAPLKESGSDVALAVHGALLDASEAPLLRLLFTPEGEPSMETIYSKTLTVITTPGIVRAVDGTPRRDWNPMEIGADAVLRLVALFTDRLVYSKARGERCVAIFDEAESLTDFGPGRSMLSRLGRDHSKWNIAVYLGVKSVNEQMLSGELKNFLASVFVGKMASIEPAEAVLPLLGLEDKRYAQVLMNLSSVVAGEFVHRDVDGRIGSLKIDVDYHPALKAALMTDPVNDSSDWMLEEEAY